MPTPLRWFAATRRRRSVHTAMAIALTIALAIALASLTIVADSPRAAASPSAATVRTNSLELTAEEVAFIAAINDLRTGRGLQALSVDVELTLQARIWAQTMTEAGSIFHTDTLDAGISADWLKLGENVGVGPTVGSLFDAFVASPGHLANLVEPGFERIGVGVVLVGDRMFTAHRFMSLQPSGSANSPEHDLAPGPLHAESGSAVDASETPASTGASGEVGVAAPTPSPAVVSPAQPTAPPAQAERILVVLRTLERQRG